RLHAWFACRDSSEGRERCRIRVGAYIDAPEPRVVACFSGSGKAEACRGDHGYVLARTLLRRAVRTPRRTPGADVRVIGTQRHQTRFWRAVRTGGGRTGRRARAGCAQRRQLVLRRAAGPGKRNVAIPL